MFLTSAWCIPPSGDLAGLSEAAADASLDALLAAEEELIGAHRRHIETTMGVVKDEMELLARLDDSAGNGMTIEEYLEELSNILVDKAAAAAALQQQVTAFRRQMRAAAGQT